MEGDPTLKEGLDRNNSRFVSSMNRILKKYNHPFENDILISMSTLTYETPDGPKKWDTESRTEKQKKKFTKISPRPRSREKQSRGFEDKPSAAHEESSESSGADTSDTGPKKRDTVSRTEKQKKKFMKISPRPRSRGEESGAVASVGRRSEGIRLQNQNVDDGQILEKKIVPVDVILQGDERNYPKWITITTPRSSKSHHSTSPGQKQLGNRAICRKKLEFSNECSSSKYPQLQHSAVPISSNTVASPSHQPPPELSTASCGSILAEYQSAYEECSFSSTTLLGLYPSMVALLTKLMTKRSQRKVLKYMFGLLRSKRRHSRRPKLNVTVDKMRGFRKASGKSQRVCKHSAFPDGMDRMGETFIVEDKLQTTDSPKDLEYTEDEKSTYKHFSEPSFITSTANSDSRKFHLVKEKTQKTDFHVGTSELCSSACSSHGNRNNSIPTTNCSPARSSNTMFIYPQKTTSFQCKESFSSSKQNSSKTDKEIDAAFDELYYRGISGEYLKPLTLTRPLINSQNLKEKGTLVKSNRSDSERSLKQCDIEFEKLCGNSIPRSPGLQTASNFRKYEEIEIPETVNALVNSPVRTYSAISSVKRAGNFQNHPLCSPVKRLKFIPGHCFSSSKCQEISHSKEGNLQTGGMDFLSMYNCSKPTFFADHNCHCQGSGSHDSSHQSFLGIPGTSLQESGTAGAHSGWPGAMENCSSLRNVSKCHPRISRKLSYTDGKDQL
ncbi:Holliday junction recognition protein isoform X2 [Serinus canaria]|uniref:Holliday junction recognition protein isoform X2 n=1 Tax=Serinus canaria TaxID=9135 RepID=UPI0021CCB14F|nr:Holliday junction recognition protein isoform X2 [Serinus canaria]